MKNIRYQTNNYSLEKKTNHQHTKEKSRNKRQNKRINMYQEREKEKNNTLHLSINGFFLVFCGKFPFT